MNDLWQMFCKFNDETKSIIYSVVRRIASGKFCGEIRIKVWKDKATRVRYLVGEDYLK